MDTNTKIKMSKAWRVLKRTGIILVGLFGLLILLRLPFYIQNKNTEEQVLKIHTTRLTMDDVMGVNLPPDPGAEADKTVAGIDANKNGIRDDVELAIFKEYPNSAKTRAVLLQYALALQMEVTQPFENEKNVTEVVREEDRADSCMIENLSEIKDYKTYIVEIDRLDTFVKERQLDTTVREKFRNNFYGKLRSFSPLEGEVCDIDLLKLHN